MTIFCTRCVMPSTKPDLTFDSEGVCSACSAFNRRQEIDWDSRREELSRLLEGIKSKGDWDCVVPVSGGKDSTYQVLIALQMGLKPLAVTATTCDLSAIGRRNLTNISRLGVDHIEWTTSDPVRRKLNRLMLERTGDISWPEHLAIFTVPVKIAASLSIPLILWGENSQNEYGGPLASQEKPHLDRDWLEEFGGLLGQRLSDLVDEGALTEREAAYFRYPSDESLKAANVSGVFLGHFLPWDGFRNAVVAGANGFESAPQAPSGSLLNYENLDNRQTVIHDYFKYLKYGFGRVSDHVSMQIRRDRLSRDEGVALVRKLDGRYPEVCLDSTLGRVLEKIDLSRAEFDRIADSFTNAEIFVSGKGSGPHKRVDGSPLKREEDVWGDN